MYFQYDNSGTPLGFVYNETQYFYLTNTMGDVLGITEANGNLIAQYLYDDWGKLVSIDTADAETSTAYREIAEANPLRYRGYYFDSETGYYYLQSRYYAPNICRFINSDAVVIPLMVKGHYLGDNLFAYCCNNPVDNDDSSGCFIFTIIFIAKIIKSARLSQLLSSYNNSTYFKVSKSNGKGKITIPLEGKKGFCQAIYEAMQTSESDTFKLLATYAEEMFYKKYRRNFLFDTDCLAKEIKDHVKGWLWANNYKGVSAPCALWFYCAYKNNSDKKKEMKKHCDKIDISENDVWDYRQVITFGYFNGIRKQYKFTNHDPYYNPYKYIRSQDYRNPKWTMS